MTPAQELSEIERRSSEMREQGKSLLPAEYQRMSELHTAVRLEERARAKARETR